MYGVKNINKNELENRKFKYLTLETLDNVIVYIEKKHLKKFEINKIYEIKNYDAKILLDFCLVLDRKYCENTALAGEDVVDENDHYIYPRELQRRISNILEVNTGLLESMCTLDDEEEVVTKYEIYKPSSRKIKKETKKSYLQVDFDDDTITVKLNVPLEDAIIDNKLDHISSRD